MSSLTTDGTGSLNLPLTLDGLNSLNSTISDSALLVDGSNKMNASLNLGSNRLVNVASGIAGSDGVNVTQLSSYLPLTGTTSALNMNNKKITNTAVGTVSTDVATLQNVSNSIAGINTFLRLDGSSVMAADMDLGNHWVWGSPTGTPPDPSNLISLQFSQDQLNAALSTVLSKGGGTMTGGISMGNNSITNLAPAVNNTDAASWIDVKARTALYLPVTGGTLTGGLAVQGIINATGSLSNFQALSATSATLTGPINMNTSKITNLGNGTLSTDAAAYGQVTSAVGNCLALTGGTLTGSVAMSSNKITGLQNGTLSTDAATYGQVTSAVATCLPLSGGSVSGVVTMGANINMGSHKVTQLLDGTNPQDAAAFGQIAAATSAYFPLAGGIITGNLQVNGTVNTSNINVNGNWVQGCNLGTPPSQDTLVSKQYLDARVGACLALSGGTLSGNLNTTTISPSYSSTFVNQMSLLGGSYAASGTPVTVTTAATQLQNMGLVTQGQYLLIITISCGPNASAGYYTPTFSATGATLMSNTYSFPNSTTYTGATFVAIYTANASNLLTISLTTSAGSTSARANLIFLRIA